MKSTLDIKTKTQIEECINLLKVTLKEDLLGVYLYGSSIFGGLQKFSDIDIFAVSNRPTTLKEKREMVSMLLSISGIYMKTEKRPLEVMIVVKSEVNPWHYPPKFDFQYGDWLRKDFESGKVEPWGSKIMPDLAILVTQVLLVSETLYGPKPSELLDPVPYSDFIIATTKEVNSLMKDLKHDTRNVLLTFARIWSTVETGKIQTKPGAATWAIERLPSNYKPVMNRALEICIGQQDEYWEDMNKQIKPCADYIVEQINKEVALIKKSSLTREFSIKYKE